MASYQNILVAIDPMQDEQPALRRAVYLNRHIGGRIKAFLAIYNFSHEIMTLLSPAERATMHQQIIDQHTERLRQQTSGWLSSGVNITIKVMWHHNAWEAIMNEVIEEQHDLVLKTAQQHDYLHSLIFTPTDWQLLRKCPCPVWMVRNKPWPEYGKALIAVNLVDDNPHHNELNLKLIREAAWIAENTGNAGNTEIHLVSAYPATPATEAVELSEFDPKICNSAIRAHSLISMKKLRQLFSIDESHTHVEEGLPAKVIQDIADRLGAGVVVLGTIGRTGISAALLGNTTEQVIDQLRCDLLTIKPDGFNASADLDTADAGEH